MKKFLMFLIIVLCLNAVCIGACPEQIKTFYITYLNNILHNNSENDVLCKTYLTKGLQERVKRLINATGADPIIRAQDTNMEAIETLDVKDLAEDWYLVSYFWRKGDNTTLTEIPLKARNVDGECKISYITPIWNGSQYGNELLSCEGKEVCKIDQTNELSFLKSFYNVYIALYCAMPEGLNGKLSSLRMNNLSQNALEQFKNAESESLKDGFSDYDLLIDNFDFDCLWCRSVKFKHLIGTDYQITYRKGDTVHKVIVSIQKKGDSYTIDGFNHEPNSMLYLLPPLGTIWEQKKKTTASQMPERRLSYPEPIQYLSNIRK